MSRLGRWLIVVAVLLWLGWESFFVVDETELAIVTQMGQFRRSVMHPGLQFKIPLLQQAEKMESRILVRHSARRVSHIGQEAPPGRSDHALENQGSATFHHEVERRDPGAIPHRRHRQQ